MVELNFGASNYSRWAPGVPLVENKIFIPETGDLRRRSIDDYGGFGPEEIKKLVPEETCLYGCPVISFKKNISATRWYERTLYLIWITEREEWVEIEHDHWIEACCQDDESCSGPWELSDFLAEKILEVYGISSDIGLAVEKVRYTSPAELEELHKEVMSRDKLTF